MSAFYITENEALSFHKAPADYIQICLPQPLFLALQNCPVSYLKNTLEFFFLFFLFYN